MKHLALLTLLAALSMGCNKPAEEPTPPTPAATAQAGQAGGGGGIAPMTSTPIPNAPIAGTDSVQGGGSAVGQSAKDRARSGGGGSSLDQMPADDQ